MFGELYRRGDGWKFRAIGQGYASGLKGLAVDFGITVEDDEPAQPAADPLPTANQPAIVAPPASPVAQPAVRERATPG